jgi:hypothetical protein
METKKSENKEIMNETTCTDSSKQGRLPWHRPTVTTALVSEQTAAGCIPCPDGACSSAQS